MAFVIGVAVLAAVGAIGLQASVLRAWQRSAPARRERAFARANRRRERTEREAYWFRMGPELDRLAETDF